MNRTIFPFRNLAPLVTMVLGIVVATAAQATASQPPPGRGEMSGSYHRPGASSGHHLALGGVTAQFWVLFSAGVLAALVVGAALMHLSQRRRAQLAH